MRFFSNKWTPLFLSNFLGVYNDNFLKNCIVFIAVGWAMPAWLTQSQLISIVSASLVVPYLFLSPLGGRLAVVYSKKRVFRFFKLIELPIMAVACTAFYFQWVLLAVVSVLLMGVQSCLYSPSKYSLIRDIGGEKGVSYGSGMFETMAFLGILIGTVTAAVVSDLNNNLLIYSLFVGLALLGYLVTRSIRAQELPTQKENLTNLNPIRFLEKSFRFAQLHLNVNIAIFGASAFWLIGGMLQMNLIIHCKYVYQSTNTVTGMIMAVAAIGIALGCWVAGKISGKMVKKGLILIGLGGMIGFLLLLTFVALPLIVFAGCVFGAAFMGGFFQIPCLSMLQQAQVGRKLGDMIAYLNLVTFVFVLLGTLLFSVTTHFTNENSFAVFGAILGICVLVLVSFVAHSAEFWLETKKIFSRHYIS
jgi:acyl-[acyl-carrier-protein]-phospholipid O-acyltransferase/long-chain-fatty-acid--[acyl-carrier-protein] ligase